MTVALLGGVANWRPVLQPVAPSATIRAEHTLRLVRLGQQDLARLQEVLKLSTLRRVSVQEWSTFTSGPLSHRKNWWFRGRTMKLGARTQASSTKRKLQAPLPTDPPKRQTCVPNPIPTVEGGGGQVCPNVSNPTQRSFIGVSGESTEVRDDSPYPKATLPTQPITTREKGRPRKGSSDKVQPRHVAAS